MPARVSPQRQELKGTDESGEARDVLVTSQGEVYIKESRITDLLERMLVQLQIINVHMSEMTGAEPGEEDVHGN